MEKVGEKRFCRNLGGSALIINALPPKFLQKRRNLGGSAVIINALPHLTFLKSS